MFTFANNAIVQDNHKTVAAQNGYAFDTTSPRAFAVSILPYLEEKTGLKANLEKLPLPPIYISMLRYAAGVYDHNINEIDVDWMQEGSYIYSVIAHELVHWLQNANGFMSEGKNRKSREEIEAMAYNTQVAFIRDWLHKNPEEYGLTNERINEILYAEANKPMAYRHESKHLFSLNAWKTQSWLDMQICFTVAHMAYFGLVFAEGHGIYAFAAGGLFFLVAANEVCSKHRHPSSYVSDNGYNSRLGDMHSQRSPYKAMVAFLALIAMACITVWTASLIYSL